MTGSTPVVLDSPRATQKQIRGRQFRARAETQTVQTGCGLIVDVIYNQLIRLLYSEVCQQIAVGQCRALTVLGAVKVQRAVSRKRWGTHGVPIFVFVLALRPRRRPLGHSVDIAYIPSRTDDFLEHACESLGFPPVSGVQRVSHRRDDEVNEPAKIRWQGAVGPGEQIPAPLLDGPDAVPARQDGVPVHWGEENDPAGPEPVFVHCLAEVDQRRTLLEG
mmetsp:Transcript_24727/g.79854  ORF Transcript_24727/g.79854 Transcript_24727/m.79854 type:complete len:219 (+) Transcript_24727:540-1196(+)